jgi:hypothetical protein
MVRQRSSELEQDIRPWVGSPTYALRRVSDLERDPLGLTSEEIRRLGYEVVDLLADQLTDRSIPAMRRGDPHELRDRLGGPPPGEPREWARCWSSLRARCSRR